MNDIFKIALGVTLALAFPGLVLLIGAAIALWWLLPFLILPVGFFLLMGAGQKAFGRIGLTAVGCLGFTGFMAVLAYVYVFKATDLMDLEMRIAFGLFLLILWIWGLTKIIRDHITQPLTEHERELDRQRTAQRAARPANYLPCWLGLPLMLLALFGTPILIAWLTGCLP